MQIIEHQNIQLTNLISYTTNIKPSDILKLISHISNNLQARDLKKTIRYYLLKNGIMRKMI